MKECITKIEKQVEQMFNKRKVASFIKYGDFSGPKLSDGVVMLVNSKRDMIRFTHPDLVHDYQNTLIVVKATRNNLSFELHETAKNYPDVMRIWNEVLCNHQDD